MTEQLLNIKIHTPPLADGVLARPALLQRLEAGLRQGDLFARPLTLISAPAGYGKTTLARHWLAGREGSAAWYSLDSGDNHRERFWLYLAASLQSASSSVGRSTMEILRSLSDGSLQRDSFLTPLLNDLFGLDHAVFLVLDDYHLIDASDIHQDMAYFIENLPPTVHIVVTTRSEPPWPLARWRARGSLGEVRQKDLTFSSRETSALLHEIKGLPLDEPLVHALHRKTEGWVTGLQLAALSLHERSDSAAFVAAFTGSHRHVFHFLSDEVLSHQEPGVQDFLRRTSILERFCGPLCQAVTKNEEASHILQSLERRNAFVISLDDQGTWYRYHPLFAELMHHQLQSQEPHHIPELHSRASDWFLEAGRVPEALKHSLEAHHQERAAAILETHLQGILAAEGPGLVVQSLGQLAPDTLRHYPELTAQRAWFHLVLKGREEAEQCLALAESVSLLDPALAREFAGKLAVVKAYYNIYAQDFAAALAYAEQALQQLPKNNHYWRSKVGIISGDSRLFAGNPKDAYPLYHGSYENHQRYGNVYLVLSSGFKVATTLYYLGRLTEAEDLTRSCLDMAHEQGFSEVPRTGVLWTLQGELLREKGDLSEAETCIAKGLDLSTPEKPSFGWNSLFQVALRCSQGQFENALAVIESLEELDRQVALPHFIGVRAAGWKAHILTQLGQPGRANDVLRSIGVDSDGQVDGGLLFAWLVYARLLLKGDQDSRTQAKGILQSVREIADAGQNRCISIEAALAQAAVANAAGEAKTAQAFLVQALKIGCQGGYRQVFFDYGRPVAPLFATVQRQLSTKDGVLGRYADSLAEQLDTSEGAATSATEDTLPTDSPADQASPLVEDLTERESEILQLLAEGLSNQGTADRLFVTQGTIKWHTSNIYGKLGVSNRTQAVAVARRLGLIDAPSNSRP